MTQGLNVFKLGKIVPIVFSKTDFLFHSDSIITLTAVCHSGFVAFSSFFFVFKRPCYLSLGLESSFSPHELMKLCFHYVSSLQL